ncbi:unnamed protein product [Rotaria sordida]|uniref:Uncharacterized protein n=1 Tax=Rotaria sordida TaxID=392033 RepID=A0A814FKV4_9BILA|nr:unnamed protein product [Rotaria sordida]CAF1341731.1 unnamed protein product [Rotaria sordida]CAF1389285.1 unnamed protein product [Rotaria sordida]CAF3877893.1 unnamed protein product [Rotaria sordida]
MTSIIQDAPNEIQKLEEKAETLKTIFQNKSIDDQHYQHLWLETFDYRQNFIKQNITTDLMEQFPVYSNSSMILTDVKLLTGVNLDYSVKEKMNLLSNEICSNNKFLTDMEKIQMRTLFESTPFEPTPFEPTSFEQRPTRKCKSDEKLDFELLSQETDSSKQKTTRNIRPKRRRQ